MLDADEVPRVELLSRAREQARNVAEALEFPMVHRRAREVDGSCVPAARERRRRRPPRWEEDSCGEGIRRGIVRRVLRIERPRRPNMTVM